MYDDAAKKLGIKIIGTVESDLNYSAINYNDPITVGIAQWFGRRAANILERMRTTNPTAWYGVQASIANQIITVPATDLYWDSRYLTSAEGESLKPVLTRNQAIQNTQLIEDMEGYKTIAISYGFDPDSNTATVLYFFAMHHQSPASALEVVSTLDTAATLDEIHAATLAHAVLGQYGRRYDTVRNLIIAADLSGVDPVPDPPAPDPVAPNGNAKLITSHGDLLMVNFKDDERVTYYPDGRGHWMPRGAQLPPVPPAPTQPPPPPDTTVTGEWVHPLPGATISSPYGPRSFDGFHWGADLVTISAGASVLAPTRLVITRAFEAGDPAGNGTAGTYVKGHTVDGAYTFNFYHMVAGSLNVAAGDTVDPGHVLGIEGATGNVTGRHLHFEAYLGNQTDAWPPPYGSPVEPLAILRNHGVTV